MPRAICPGSFDPVTNGHVDVITRASCLFEELIVVVMVNPSKKPAFTTNERMEMLRKTTGHLPNVRVDSYQGLLVNYVRENNIQAIVKGLRAMSDFEHEFQMAMTNKKLFPGANTVFLAASSEHMYLASSLVKQVAAFDGDITDFVPPEVLPEIRARLSGKSIGPAGR